MTKEKPRFGTHRKALTAAVSRTFGPIIEVGAGKYSTPLLLDLAKDSGITRTLVTVEHDPIWQPKEAKYHIVLDSLTDGVALFPRYSVALIDGGAQERAVALDLLLPKTDYLVVHDTERLQDYPGLAEVLSRVIFRYDFQDEEPWTSVVSDRREFAP